MSEFETKPAPPTGCGVRCRLCGHYFDAAVWPTHAAVEHGIVLAELADAPILSEDDE